MRILHIVAPDAWAAAERSGEYLPDGFDRDGFVHFSFADQVDRVANAIYRDEPELIVVEIESDEVPAELKIEDSYGAGEEFPHVYGPIPVTAQVGRHALVRTEHGDWAFSARAGSDPASQDR